MDLHYFHSALTISYHHLSGGAITEVYQLPNQDMVFLMRMDAKGMIVHVPRSDPSPANVIEAVQYVYESIAHASFALVNWDPMKARWPPHDASMYAEPIRMSWDPEHGVPRVLPG